MERTTLEKCLVSLSVVKKNLVLSKPVLEAWYQALREVPDREGIPAFKTLAKKTTYGDVEPAHIVEISGEMRRHADEEWIFNAPRYPSEHGTPEHRRWQAHERSKLYRSWDSRTEEVLLVQNPECWDFDGGRYLRPEPIHTGEKILRKNIWWKAS